MDKIKNEFNEKSQNNFLKCKSIHDYFVHLKDKSINNNYKKNNNNIYIDYLEKPSIIFQDKGDNNNKNLKLLFNELNKDMDDGNNILFPFLDICPNLVKAYIQSDLDDFNSISKSIYLKTFEKLKNNCFISKEILFPIYDYFSNLYDIITDTKEIKEKDIISFKKFNKMIKLFEIFYDTDIDKDKRNKSSFCFLGNHINIIFNQVIELSQINQISIHINFLNSNYIQYLKDDLILIKINGETVNYTDLLYHIKNNQILKIIKITIIKNKINIEYIFNNKNNVKTTKSLKLSKLQNIFLLEELYGQISSIDISLDKDNNLIEYEFLPISIRDNNIYYINKKFINDNIINQNNIIPQIIITNQNLININYINYNDDQLDIIDYFGGIIQFLPFYRIGKNLKLIFNKGKEVKENKNIINISKIILSKKNSFDKEIFNDFINYLIKIIIKKLIFSNEKKKLLKQYFWFVYYILVDLDLELTVTINSFEEDKDIYDSLELIMMMYHNQKNTDIKRIKEETKNITDNIDKTKYLFLFEKPKKTINRLYHKYMKKLFCFNNFWSKRYIFFPKRYNNNLNITNKQIKYKQINYYTKNFQLPFFYPILEYKKYYPRFKNYKGNLYKENKDNILEYDYELDTNEKALHIFRILISAYLKNISKISEKCCLVKNTHHVFGNLKIIKNNNKKNKNNITLTFRYIKKKNINKNCNKIIDPTKSLSNNKKTFIPESNLCFGAVFPCPKKELKRNVIIKSKNILFILIRNYYHRVSGIEIFTINKSYYFNFKNPLDLNNIRANKIINEIKNNSLFKKINMKNNKLTLGYYNKKYYPYLFPLFEEEIDYWDNKINYYNNYDKIMLINIFSNRSFRDIYQYPVFPTLYNLIDYKRQMENHIGLQTITEESKKRKEIFYQIYQYNEKKGYKDILFLFNVNYLNPPFTFNYLLRVFPYSFLAIEFQGDNFDDPNRLFSSIEGTLKSTLNFKTDLREMIPELYYMIDLFYNKNNISFQKLNNGRTIDNVLIKDSEIIESEIKRKNNYAQFLYMMRRNLEEEKEINKWIDLIFGINQKYYEDKEEKHKYKCYEDCTEINFENNLSILEDNLIMDKVNFGLLPHQLFNKEFPKEDIKNKEKIFEQIKKLNKILFKDEHLIINSPIQTFLCKGRISIDENYIKIINPNNNSKHLNKLNYYYNIPKNIAKNININNVNNYFYNELFGNLDMKIIKTNDNKYKENMSLVDYYFVGDIFGGILIYCLKKIKKNEYEEEKETKKEKKLEKEKQEKENQKKDEEFEIEDNNIIEQSENEKNNILLIDKKLNLKMILIKKLYNHTKEIKYIDFNPRLNILLSYSLDNFINIYIFPKFKLINVIDTNSFRDNNDKNYFEEVVLLSFPFPSIVCHNKEYIYYLSINGELIKYDKLLDVKKIRFSIDKNLGIVIDRVEIKNLNKNRYIFNCF